MTDFAWLIEAPGPMYLRTRTIGHHPDFGWTHEANEALRFISKDQADGVMMAVRRMEPALFAFESTLGNAWPREHGWLALATGAGGMTAGPILAVNNLEQVQIIADSYVYKSRTYTAEEVAAALDGVVTEEMVEAGARALAVSVADGHEFAPWDKKHPDTKAEYIRNARSAPTAALEAAKETER